MNVKLTSCALLFCGCIFLTACEKPTGSPAPQTIQYEYFPIIGYTSEDGVMLVERVNELVKNDSTSFPILSNRAVAQFYSSPGKKPFLEVGGVRLGDTLHLDQENENFYEVSSFAKPFVITSNTTSVWKVEENELVDFPNVDASLAGFPGMPEIESSLVEINRKKPLKLVSVAEVTDADYMVFSIRGDSADLYVHAPAQAREVIFPSYELAKLKKSEVVVEIAAVKKVLKSVQGKTFAVINQSVSRRKVKAF